MAGHKRTERRLYPRVYIGPGFTIRFAIAGQAFKAIPITNLSENGCFATFPLVAARHVAEGTLLEDLVLEHPQLPHEPMTGRIVHVLDQLSGLEEMEYIGLGIHFQDTAPGSSRALRRFVARRFASPDQPARDPSASR